MARQGFDAFLERPEDNPFLLEVLAGDASLAYQCQEWFLSAVEEFLREASPDRDIVIDQDPAATTLVYGQGLRSRGLLSEVGANKLTGRLQAVEDLMARWGQCKGVFLDAGLETLRSRIRARDAERPESFWLEELHEDFRAFAGTAGYMKLDTSGRDPTQVLEGVLELIGES